MNPAACIWGFAVAFHWQKAEHGAEVNAVHPATSVPDMKSLGRVALPCPVLRRLVWASVDESWPHSLLPSH